MTAPNDKRSLPFGGAFAIQDTEIIEFMRNIDIIDALWNDKITKDFCNNYIDWIKQTKNNIILGINNFKYSVFSAGTTQAFDMFYIKHKNRRFRCFKGEYIYHQLAWRNNFPNWKFIEDEKLESTDAVIISLPFSDTGNKHQSMDEVLIECNKLNIPVLIDCAYFGVCSNIQFDFNHTCITDITFSLSKTFPIAHARVGIRFTKVDDDDLMFVYDKINYNNRISAKIGLELIKKYNTDYLYDKYVEQQLRLCRSLNIENSNTVLFGIDKNNQYPEYNRGNITNRLGLHKHYDI